MLLVNHCGAVVSNLNLLTHSPYVSYATVEASETSYDHRSVNGTYLARTSHVRVASFQSHEKVANVTIDKEPLQKYQCNFFQNPLFKKLKSNLMDNDFISRF